MININQSAGKEAIRQHVRFMIIFIKVNKSSFKCLANSWC